MKLVSSYVTNASKLRSASGQWPIEPLISVSIDVMVVRRKVTTPAFHIQVPI